MSLLCTTCATVGDIPLLDLCELTFLQDTGDSFVFVKCSYQFLDIEDTAEWVSAVASGDVRVAPRGFWAKPAPAQTTFDVSCNQTVTTQQGQEYQYTTNNVNAVTLEEQLFFKDLRDNYLGWLVIPVTCAGVFAIDDSYLTATTVVGDSPGQQFYFTQPPDKVITSGRDQLTQWVMNLVIPKNGIDCVRYLPGVKGALWPI